MTDGTFSNTTENEMKSIIETQNKEREATAKCLICGARRERESMMNRFEDEISRWLRETNASASDSCILCVEKHVGKALVLWDEMITAQGSGNKDGKASVHVYRNHVKIIGHLGNAVDESIEFTELHELLKSSERSYRYEGITPDWDKIIELMEKQKHNSM